VHGKQGISRKGANSRRVSSDDTRGVALRGWRVGAVERLRVGKEPGKLC